MAETDLGPDSRPAPVPAPALGDVLRAAGEELAALGRLASDLQAVVGPSGPGSEQGGAALYRLQALDPLTQALHGMSDFLLALAPSVPAHLPCDAARAAEVITLSDLACRLGRPLRDPSPASAGAPGELELFEA